MNAFVCDPDTAGGVVVIGRVVVRVIQVDECPSGHRIVVIVIVFG